jgi:NADH-quinone oxidoreductase subunit A
MASGSLPDAGQALFIHVVLSFVVVGGLVGLSFLLRERRDNFTKDETYESGVVPAGPPHGPYNAPYFLIAALFVIFDLEAAILISWAVAAGAAGWTGFIAAAVFIITLLAALFYLWADGALEWAPEKDR